MKDVEHGQPRRQRLYRSRLPRWLRPTIDISPDPERCSFCTARRFNLIPPDYSIEVNGQPDEPMALSVCTHSGECRYRIILSPQPWHGFDPVPSCVGYEAAYYDPSRCLVDLAPGDLPWWPQHPPNRPHPEPPSIEELMAFAAQILIPQELRALNRTDPSKAHTLGLSLLKKRHGYQVPGSPMISITAKEIRIWNIPHRGDGKPDVTMPLNEFLARVLPPTVVQTRLI